MKLKTWILFVLISFLSLNAKAYERDVKFIKEVTTCTYSDKLSQQTVKLPVMVYVLILDKNPKKYDTHVVLGKGVFQTDIAFTEKEKKALEKFLKWAEKVKVEKLDVSKELLDVDFLTMTFVSTKNGQESFLFLHYSNRRKAVSPINVVFNIQEVKELIALINKAPQAIAAFLENQKKGEILK